MKIDSKEIGSGSHCGCLVSSDSGTSGRTTGGDGGDTSASCSIPLEMTTENIENNSGADEVHDDDANNETNVLEESNNGLLLSNSTELAETSQLSQPAETSLTSQPDRYTSVLFEKGNRIYKCGKCDAVFSSSPILSDHWKSNHSENNSGVDEVHDDDANSETNVLEESKDGLFHSNNTELTETSLLSQPAETSQIRQPDRYTSVLFEKGNRIYKCGKCDAVFSSSPILSDHLKSNHSENNSGADEVHDDNANNETNVSEESKDSPLLSNNTELTETSQLRQPAETSILSQPDRYASVFFRKGNRNYKCGECVAVFSSSPILSDHWKSNHSACSVCGVVSPDPLKRRLHYETSHGIDTMPERTMICGICGAKFIHTFSLQKHIQSCLLTPKQHARETCSGSAISEAVAPVKKRMKLTPLLECEAFKCGICHKTFITSRILSDHWKSNHSTCSACGGNFYVPTDYLKHLQTSHGTDAPERPFVCGVCGSTHTTCRSLYNHVRQIHLKSKRKKSVYSVDGKQITAKQPPGSDASDGGKMFKCGTCGAFFSTALILSDHWKSQHSACSLCGKTFYDPQDHYIHCAVNHDANLVLKGTFVCAVCNEKFVETRSISTHVQKMHPKPKCNSFLGTGDEDVNAGQHTRTENCFQLFKCCECDSFFSSVNILSSHWKMQHGECILCWETFSIPKDRYRHVELKHDKISVPFYPFQCGMCGRKFSHIKSLLPHARIQHTEEYQKYESVVCTQNQQSAACAASPTGPNMVKCGECDEEFKSMSGLLDHWPLQHSACSVCGEKFANPSDKYRHFQAEHKALLFKRFACAVCGAKCSHTKHLLDHHRKVHRNIWKQLQEMQEDETRWTPSYPQEEDQDISRAEAYSEGGREHQVNVGDSDKLGDGNADSNTDPSWPDLGQDCADKHEELGFRCGPCDARFGSVDQLCAHWTSQHSTCGICRESCPDPYHLQQHMQTSHDMNMAEDRPFICATCGAAFLEASCLSSHVQCSHQQKPSSAVTQGDTSGCKTYEYSCQCAECGAYFKSTRSLLHHWQCNHQSCSVCGVCFKLPKDLDKHLVSSHGQLRVSAMPFVCAICGVACVLPLSLVSHVLEFHSKQVRDVTDSSVAVEAGSLQERAATKTKELCFHMCHVCGKNFKTTAQLKLHLLVHSDERPLACTLCTKSFKTKVMLTVHMRTHTKEKPFMCDLCGQSFALKNTLTYHVNSHTNAKPYKCRFCGKGFNNHSGLRQHSMSHTGYVSELHPVPCKLCGKCVIGRNLKRHMLTHTSLRPFPCKICNKTFRHRGNLSYHMSHSHKSN